MSGVFHVEILMRKQQYKGFQVCISCSNCMDPKEQATSETERQTPLRTNLASTVQ